MADEFHYGEEERRREPRAPRVPGAAPASRALPPDESLHDARVAELDEHGRPLSRQRRRKRARRALKIVAGLVGGVVLVAAGAVFVLTNTDWGRERVRRQALAQLQKQVNGRVRIGALRGNLLTGATIENLVITDSAGNPFVAAERVKARYSIRGILDKKLHFSDVELLRPVIVLDRPPEGQWNWKRIFAKEDKPATPEDTTAGYGDWVAFENATLIDGRLIVKTPWRPSSDKITTQAQRDSATRVALAGGTRNRVIQVAGGYQKVMDFRSLDGRFPLLRIKDPQHEDMLVRVASANAVLAMFLPPEGDLRDLAGDFRIWDDSLTFQGVRAAFPGSKVGGSGRYMLESGELQLAMKGAPAALADFRWAYPRLPSQGGGTLGFDMHWTVEPNEAQRYEMIDADVRVGKSHLVGDLGFTLTDTVAFHGTQLRVADFDTRLLEQLIEGFEMPVNGTATGRLALGGGLADLHLDTDLAFTEPKTGTSRAEVKGVIGFGDEGFVKAQALRMRLYPLQVGIARVFLPEFPLGGTLAGLLTLDGTPDRWLASSADVRHADLGQESHIVGRASLGFSAFPGREFNFVDADVRVAPLALAPTIGRYAPGLGLRGATAGTIALTGPFSNLRVNTALRTSDGGGLRVTGAMDIASQQIGYNLRAGFDVFDASVLMASMPRTQLSLDAAARGRGTDPATMTSDIALALRASKWNEVAVDSAQLAASIAGGILTLDTLRVAGPGVRAGAGGRFGLAADKRGDLSYALQIDSLGVLRRWIPVDSGEVAPRPMVVQQALARARGDSTRLARATEAERAVTGTPMPRVPVDTPTVVKRDSLAGRVWAAGRVVGTLQDFDARGRVGAQGVVWNGNTIGAARAEYAWTDGPGVKGSIVLGADLDTVRATGFDLERVEARVAHGMDKRGGLVQLLLRQDEGKEYAAHADYRMHQDHNEVHLDDLRLRFDTTTWASARPGTVRWGTRGIEVDNIDLRSGPTGRVYVDGFIPRSTGQPASLQASITDFEIGDVVSLAQSDLEARGRLSAGVKFEGTLAEPRFNGAVGVIDPVWRGSPLPELRTAFAYDGTRLEAEAQALQNRRVIAMAEGRVAVRLGSGTGPRISKSTPIQGTIVADSLPLDALPKFTDAVANVQGRAVGRINLAGTVGAPKATGALGFDLGSFKVVPTGTRFSRLSGRMRFVSDSIVIDTLGGWASGGPVSLEGGVGIASLSKPSVDLRLTTTNARLLDNDQGKVTADVEASMYGPFDNVYVNGRVRVREGVIYLPENDHREVIQSGDPALFAVADTSVSGSDDELVPTESPFMKNLKMSIGLLVDRNTWVRSTEANVEIFSEDWLRISVDRGSSSVVLDGVLSTERGEYTFLSKRFQIRRGSATFVGTPDLNPTVQATAEYEVNVPAREALFIRLLIGGTVRAPRLSLESNSQPPINQSDLLSYLAFGRSSSSLLQMGGSGLGSGSGGGGLAGATGALARNQIAGIALGVAVNELERGFARRASLDVFNITPAPDVQTELMGGDVSAVAASTEIEGGRYWNQSRLFTAATLRVGTLFGNTPVPPGLSAQYRFTPQWRLEGSWSPRYLLQTPTLEQQELSATSVLGLFLIREWRF